MLLKNNQWTHRNKIKKPCWQQLVISKSLLPYGRRDTEERMFPASNRKTEHHHWILHIRISLDTMFQLKVNIFIFWTKFAQKGCFRSKTEKSEHHHWILHIWVGLDTKFQIELTILNFWTKLAQKGCFQSKTEKVNNWILLFRFSLGTKFQLKLTVDLWDPIGPKRVFPF